MPDAILLWIAGLYCAACFIGMVIVVYWIKRMLRTLTPEEKLHEDRQAAE